MEDKDGGGQSAKRSRKEANFCAAAQTRGQAEPRAQNAPREQRKAEPAHQCPLELPLRPARSRVCAPRTLAEPGAERRVSTITEGPVTGTRSARRCCPDAAQRPRLQDHTRR